MGRRRLEIGEVGNINVTKTEKGYRARCWYRGQDGRKHQVDITRPTKTAATKAARALSEERAKLGNSDLNLNSPLSSLLAAWWATIEEREGSGDLSPGSVESYTRPYERVKAGLGHLLIRECTAPRLGEWVATEAAGKPSVHKGLRRVLSQAFSFGISQGVVRFNPGEAIPPLTVKAKKTTALTPEEVAKLRATLQQWEEDHVNRPNVDKDGNRTGGRRSVPYICDVVDVMLGTGCRIGEVLGLRWEDVNLDASPVTVTVNGSVKQRKKRNPGEQSLVWEPRPKTEAGLRTVYLPQFAADVLHRLSIERAPGAVYVFATAKGTPRSPSNVRTRLRKVCGTTFEGVTPHTFRRTVLTTIAEETDVLTASRVAGHSNTAITEAAYLRFGSTAPDTSEVLNSALGIATAK